MARDLIGKYIWIVDALKRYRKLTRQQLSELWLRSSVSDGRTIPERTFFHYRRAIEQNFDITIACTPAGEYFIDNENGASGSFSDWLFDSMAVNRVLSESTAAADCIEVEDVPSARIWLSDVLEAITNNNKITFTYAGFNRSRAEKDIIFHPYFLKRYKQRWYMAGYKEKGGSIRTYALDRVTSMNLSGDKFEKPADTTPDSIFGNIIGITSSKGETHTVRIKTTTSQAKYLRVLPLHSSQSEELHDSYSIFTYHLKLNWELVHEILSLGQEVTVLSPKELRIMVVHELKETLAHYQTDLPDEKK